MSLAPFPILAGVDDVLGKFWEGFLNWASHGKEAHMLYRFRVVSLTMSK